MTTTPPPLAADIEAGLRRLRLSAIRTLAPELLVTAKTQRWKPEELLRVFVEAEIASRDLSNARGRMKVAAFPVTKTLEEFDVAASSVPRPTFDYLAGLEWIRAKENLCLVGPAGTGKSHLLVALGHAAVEDGTPGPLLHRHRAGRDPLPGAGRQLGGQGDHPDPEGRPDPHRRDRLRSDGHDRRRAVLPTGGRRLRTAVARHRLALALRGVGQVPPRAHHRGQPARPTAASQRDRGHRRGVIPDEGSASERRSIYAGQELNIRSEGWGLLVAKSGD